MTDLRVAVITGRHPYDVVNFNLLLRSLTGVDAYVQSLEEFAAEFKNDRLDQYDVFVFYNFHREEVPQDENTTWWQGKQWGALQYIADTNKGLVILHHGILCWPEMELWNELTGLSQRKDFKIKFNQTLDIKNLNTSHPITANLQDWQMIDETYLMGEPESDCELLLSTDHPLSMKYLAWTRLRGEKRIFNLQSGHDNQTWQNQNFKTVLERGIHWVAKRI